MLPLCQETKDLSCPDLHEMDYSIHTEAIGCHLSLQVSETEDREVFIHFIAFAEFSAANTWCECGSEPTLVVLSKKLNILSSLAMVLDT